jgi:hypothetical protein
MCSQRGISGFVLKGKAPPLCENSYSLVCRHRSRKSGFYDDLLVDDFYKVRCSIKPLHLASKVVNSFSLHTLRMDTKEYNTV